MNKATKKLAIKKIKQEEILNLLENIKYNTNWFNEREKRVFLKITQTIKNLNK
tara:strand:+ start:660 stop:818 length:159 start_codon:yes stop_codon:yes gene_type:complete